MFEFSVWKAAVWAVATFGIAGTIALIVFAPAAAKIALGAVVRLFAFVFSYRLGCALVAAIVAALITDYVRHSIDDSRYAAETAAFEKAQEERDERIARDTREWVLKEIADTAQQNVTTDKEVKDFTDALPKLPEGQPAIHSGNPFRVGDDAARLRKIAGQAERGSDGPQGVQKADTAVARLRDRVRNRLPGAIGGSSRNHQQGQQSN